MLRSNESAVSSVEVPSLDAFSLTSILRAVRRRKWLIAGSGGVFAGLAALYCAMAIPQYTASAQLLIDMDQARSFENNGMGAVMMDTGMVDSQVEILRSERIALAVIRKMKMVEEERARLEEQAKESSIRSFLAGLFPFMGSSAPPSDVQLERALVSDFKGRMSAERVARSYVISLTYKSPDPARAAEVANQIAEAYVVDQLESKYQATRRASVWLQERIAELRDQALAADRAVQSFKSRHDIIDTGRGLVTDQQLSELNTQLVTARAQVAEAQARYDRVKNIINRGSDAGVSDEVVSDVLNNEVINRLRGQYLDTAKREAEWAKRYGENHVAVINMRSEMKGLQRAIFNELSRIAETYKSDLEIAQAREKALTADLDKLVAQNKLTGQAQVELRELESTAQSYRALYDNFLQRYMQATQQQSFPITEARLITDATPPGRPSEPRTMPIVLGGLLLGLGVGLGLAFWRENSDRTFRTAADIEQYLGLECIGVLPAMPKSTVVERTKGSAFNSATGPLRQVIAEPLSRFSETLRAAKVSADISIVGRPVKVIGITSTLPKEGKSTVSANFAQLVAHSGSQCILVDSDLRNPSLTRSLAPDATKGVLEVVLGSAALDEVMIFDPISNLRFIPAVVPGHIFHTNEIMASKQMNDFINELKKRANYIIVDLPPVAPVVDVLASTHLVDAFIYLLEWGSSNRDLVGNVMHNNPKIHEKVLGCLLNKVDLNALRELEEYGGKYYYHKYHARYGSDY